MARGKSYKELLILETVRCVRCVMLGKLKRESLQDDDIHFLLMYVTYFGDYEEKIQKLFM